MCLQSSSPLAFARGLMALIASCGAWHPSAFAEPSLHVRASTRLELHARSEGERLRLTGALRDDLDVPLAGRVVDLRVESLRDDVGASVARALRSDAAGRFSQLLAVPFDRYRVTAAYGGDELHEPAHFDQLIDVALADVRLTLGLPDGRVISLDAESVAVELTASSDAGGADLAVTLRDEASRELASGRTDAEGSFRANLKTSALGPPGPGQLVAQTGADSQHAAAETTAVVLRESATELTLTAAWDEALQGLSLSGELRTRAGAIADKAIGLYLDRSHALTVTSDAHGRFRAVLTAANDGSGLLGREARAEAIGRHTGARFESDTPGLRSSQALEREVLVPGWPGPNLLWVILPSLASLIGVGLWLRRAGTWFGPGEPPDVYAPGVQLGAASQWRAGNQRGVDGVIEDAETGARLAGASLALVRDDGRGLVQVEPDGSFAIAQLAPGAYRVEASAPGYALATSDLKVPHAGEGSGLRVRLRSLRTLALDAHRPLLRRLFSTREEQVSATPREALSRAGPLSLPPLSASGAPSRDAPGELARLTDLVEHAAYSADTPTVEQVVAIEQHTHALIKRSG